MTYNKKNSQYNSDGKTAEEKTLETFCQMMIEKIESLQDGKAWEKPWFSESFTSLPKNLSGRYYNGMNSLMLMMCCEKNHYKIPVFMTFERVMALNYQKDKDGKSSLQLDDKGEPLPHVAVNKGAKSFPVMLTTFTCIDKETKQRINYDDYRLMSNDEKNSVNVYPKQKVYCVFNIDQTNIQEARPKLYAKLQTENETKKPQMNGEVFSFPAMDKMIEEQSWVCPIKLLPQDSCYYSISKDEIVMVPKSNFKDGESFYANLWHEQSHSLQSEKFLNTLNPSGGFGSEAYAKSELYAELTAALVATKYGITKNLKSDSAIYLKSWLDSLKQSPDYIKTVLNDVKKASSIITEHIDEIQARIDNKENIQETAHQEQKPTYYASVNYLQMADDTQIFDKMHESQDYNSMIMEAAEYDNGDSIDLSQTYSSPCRYPTDDVLAEDENYVVVYNPKVGGTYDIMRKVSEQDVRDAIIRYGLPEGTTDDVKNVAKTMVAKQFDKMTNNHIPAFEMPNGDILYVQYNQEKDTLEAGTVTNCGMSTMHSFPYDHDFSLDGNLEGVNEKLTEMTAYQTEANMESDQYVAEDNVTELDNKDDTRDVLDSFMTDVYWAARRDNGFRMSGYEHYNGKEALRLDNEKIDGGVYYLVSREQIEGQNKFFMHLYDSNKQQEVFKSREMPNNREDAYSFMRGAFYELEDYETECKQELLDQNRQESEDDDQTKTYRLGR